MSVRVNATARRLRSRGDPRHAPLRLDRRLRLHRRRFVGIATPTKRISARRRRRILAKRRARRMWIINDPGIGAAVLFSAFLVPIFRLARIFGSSDGREVVAVVTALMITIAGLAGVVTYRFVEKIAGRLRRSALALFLGANRVFHSGRRRSPRTFHARRASAPRPPSRSARPSWRNALLLGSLLGVAALFKYQALLPGGLLVLGLPFLWRGSGKRGILKLLALAFVGFLLGVVVQSTLDWFGGRGFGATFVNYLRDNIGWVYGIRARPYLILDLRHRNRGSLVYGDLRPRAECGAPPADRQARSRGRPQPALFILFHQHWAIPHDFRGGALALGAAALACAGRARGGSRSSCSGGQSRR